MYMYIIVAFYTLHVYLRFIVYMYKYMYTVFAFADSNVDSSRHLYVCISSLSILIVSCNQALSTHVIWLCKSSYTCKHTCMLSTCMDLHCTFSTPMCSIFPNYIHVRKWYYSEKMYQRHCLSACATCMCCSTFRNARQP